VGAEPLRYVYYSDMADSSGLHFSLWKQALGGVPEEVWGKTNLQTLVLADNDLTEISERVGGLRDLRMLDLGHNRLREIPAGLGELEGLSDFLYLHDNELTTLPPTLRRLRRLRYLNISENAFEVLPEAVTEMSGLIELRVTDNRLTGLPPSISRLVRLREQHVRNKPAHHIAGRRWLDGGTPSDRPQRQPDRYLTRDHARAAATGEA
jgi:Leucine-rich repeat (LRR) protein